MTVIQTAGGPRDTEALGAVLMHEHVFVLTPEVQQNYPKAWGDEDQRVADAIARLNQLKDVGIDTIVDLTVVGLGRYVPRIKRIAAATEVNIVVATGLYTFDELPQFFRFRAPRSASDSDPMTELFVEDIEEGIAGTGVRAGILKCATDEPGVTPGVERVLRAVARAHRATGVPISTHTHAGLKRGLEQQRIFEEEGVDLSRVVIGHSGDTTDIAYLEEVIARGSFVGMDRFGLDPMLSFEDRVATVAALCERGHAGKLVLSHDAACHNDWLDDELVRTALPRWHYLHISTDVLPALRKVGVTEDQVTQMLVRNPRTIFERTGAY